MKRIKLEYGLLDSFAYKGRWLRRTHLRYIAYTGMYNNVKLIFKDHYIISNVIKEINPAR